MTKFCVYVIFRITGIPCYVGKGTKKRPNSHFKPSSIKNNVNRKLAYLIRKYGAALPIIVVQDDLTNEKAKLTETALIKAIGREDLGEGPLLNRTNGGDGNDGWHPSKETKDKQRQRAIQRFASKTERQRYREMFTGFRHTESTKIKMHKSHVGKPTKIGEVTRGTHWYLTPEGIQYRAEKPRNPNDHAGRKPKSHVARAKLGKSMSALIWITDGIRDRRVLPNTIPEGWFKGTVNRGKHIRGTICITNGVNNKRLKPGEKIPAGWRRGATQKRKK